jgi:D-glycero-alpha-D-manno-heptose-7-phosphate kinase
MIVIQTPLRISFLGGGTDFSDFYYENGGAVLATAIDKYVFVIVKERFDDLIWFNYTKR